jgi:cytidine deaminase
MNDIEKRILIEKAIEARNASYSPYSKFSVGAAILTGSGRIFTGANVENASYGMTICAERSAAVKAVNEGERQFKAVACVGGRG